MADTDSNSVPPSDTSAGGGIAGGSDAGGNAVAPDTGTGSTLAWSIADRLTALLVQEQRSVLRVVVAVAPIASRDTADLRAHLPAMDAADRQRMGRLNQAIESFGGIAPAASHNAEEQYLGYLTLAYLRPRLAAAKAALVRSYESTLEHLPADAPPEVRTLLEESLAEHRFDLAVITAGIAETDAPPVADALPAADVAHAKPKSA